MEQLLKRITAKKRELDKLRPLPERVEKQLEEWLRVELTYSSNAIEGSTLSRIETAEILEKGVAAVVPGHTLAHQLEAINHAEALAFITSLAAKLKSHRDITEQTIKDIHQHILAKIDDEYAGRYRDTFIIVKGSDVTFPRPSRVPALMKHFVEWLQKQSDDEPVLVAANAHLRLVTIHPFVDGNGRTARLLMNLILAIYGYPMAVVRAEDRTEYIATVNISQKEDDKTPFQTMAAKAAESSLNAYLAAAGGHSPLAHLMPESKKKAGKLLKIGELAAATGETIHTLRYWTKQELLSVADYSPGGYQLYEPSVVEVAKKIRQLQSVERLSIEEIRARLKRAA